MNAVATCVPWHWAWTCRSCGLSEGYLQGELPDVCPSCGSNSFSARQVTVEGSSPKAGIDGLMKENVRYSRSMGVRPDMIEEAKKAYPGSEYLPDGRLVIHNRSEKLLRMSQRGMEEID